MPIPWGSPLIDKPGVLVGIRRGIGNFSQKPKFFQNLRRMPYEGCMSRSAI